MSGQGPPPFPWKTGTSESYTAFTVAVDVCQDQRKRVWSDQRFPTAEDAAAAQTLDGDAIQQIAYALLTEALRRELYLDAMVELSNNPDFITAWVNADPQGKTKLEHELANAGLTVMFQGLGKMAPSVARETFLRVKDAIESQGEPDAAL